MNTKAKGQPGNLCAIAFGSASLPMEITRGHVCCANACYAFIMPKRAKISAIYASFTPCCACLPESVAVFPCITLAKAGFPDCTFELLGETKTTACIPWTEENTGMTLTALNTGKMPLIEPGEKILICAVIKATGNTGPVQCSLCCSGGILIT